MNNWKDYIESKFQPKENFSFVATETSNTLTVKHARSGTSISFFWPESDWLKIADVIYSNERTEGYDQIDGPIEFNSENVAAMDRYLQPALETGWSSKDIYLVGKHYKSVVTFYGTPRNEKFRHYSAELGCLSIPLLPLLEPLSYIIGKQEVIQIAPINAH